MNIQAYAATAQMGPFEPFSDDPGLLGPLQVDVKVTHCIST